MKELVVQCLSGSHVALQVRLWCLRVMPGTVNSLLCQQDVTSCYLHVQLAEQSVFILVTTAVTFKPNAVFVTAQKHVNTSLS